MSKYLINKYLNSNTNDKINLALKHKILAPLASEDELGDKIIELIPITDDTCTFFPMCARKDDRWFVQHNGKKYYFNILEDNRQLVYFNNFYPQIEIKDFMKLIVDRKIERC